jgi:SAM-dependent methyltransferase
LKKKNIHNSEQRFHDSWAKNENVNYIDIFKCNEASTAPEMRWIISKIGNLKKKKILDVGCGLGEASVYFAKKGATVTALDISPEMLIAAKKLAKKNNVTIKTEVGSSEKFNLKNEQFDIIYAGNCFHHSEIKKAIMEVKKHLKPNGILVSWDPLNYNPIINIYRKIATKVRTEDEHPFKYNDIKLIKKNFKETEMKFFWLTTLIIFCIMFLLLGKNPNKERYWKTIIYENDKWKWLYLPLEKIDNILLFLFPFLKLLCWNVAIFAKK